MPWTIEFDVDFEPEFDALDEGVREKALTVIGVLAEFGPNLSRPTVDTLNDSRHCNLKELRFDAFGGVWRVAFAFDPKRTGILLATGDKAGKNEKRFYKVLIATADRRYDAHLMRLKGK